MYSQIDNNVGKGEIWDTVVKSPKSKQFLGISTVNDFVQGLGSTFGFSGHVSLCFDYLYVMCNLEERFKSSLESFGSPCHSVTLGFSWKPLTKKHSGAEPRRTGMRPGLREADAFIAVNLVINVFFLPGASDSGDWVQ